MCLHHTPLPYPRSFWLGIKYYYKRNEDHFDERLCPFYRFSEWENLFQIVDVMQPENENMIENRQIRHFAEGFPFHI